MALQVTQEAFDDTVRENMEEFGMEVSEAIQDTVKQYTAQGADLSHIFVELMAVQLSSDELQDALTNLNALINNLEATDDEITVELKRIAQFCDKGLTYRVCAGKLGVYKAILKLVAKENLTDKLNIECLNLLISLMTQQPDLLDAKGIDYIIKTMDTSKNEEILKLLLRWVKECCILHEFNRQHIFDAGLLDHLKPLLDDASSSLICCVMAVLRSLVLDDDVRVEFGKAHEHARAIASDTLCAITALLYKFKTDSTLISEILLTLSALLVRTEFCKKVEDAGGLQIIYNALQEFGSNEKLVRQCFKVLKALAGNDECKAKIIAMGYAPVIIKNLNVHKKSPQTAAIGLSCMASLTLRSPKNSEAFYESGAATTIVEIMKAHPDNEIVQRNASWAIRNMVSRSRHQNQEYLRLGVEPLLKTAIGKFKSSVYDIKTALRDLECEVELKEEWTGQGGKLTTDSKAN